MSPRREENSETQSQKLISLKKAAELSEYSADYLSLRARQGKLQAKKVGRSWQTTQQWLNEYVKSAQQYKENLLSKKKDLPKAQKAKVLFKNLKASQEVSFKDVVEKLTNKKKGLENGFKDFLKNTESISDSLQIAGGRLVVDLKNFVSKRPGMTSMFPLAFFILLSSVIFPSQVLGAYQKIADGFLNAPQNILWASRVTSEKISLLFERNPEDLESDEETSNTNKNTFQDVAIKTPNFNITQFPSVGDFSIKPKEEKANYSVKNFQIKEKVIAGVNNLQSLDLQASLISLPNTLARALSDTIDFFGSLNRRNENLKTRFAKANKEAWQDFKLAWTKAPQNTFEIFEPTIIKTRLAFSNLKNKFTTRLAQNNQEQKEEAGELGDKLTQENVIPANPAVIPAGVYPPNWRKPESSSVTLPTNDAGSRVKPGMTSESYQYTNTPINQSTTKLSFWQKTKIFFTGSLVELRDGTVKTALIIKERLFTDTGFKLYAWSRNMKSFFGPKSLIVLDGGSGQGIVVESLEQLQNELEFVKRLASDQEIIQRFVTQQVTEKIAKTEVVKIIERQIQGPPGPAGPQGPVGPAGVSGEVNVINSYGGNTYYYEGSQVFDGDIIAKSISVSNEGAIGRDFSVAGSTFLGDDGSDTLTVYARATFENEAIFNGTLAINNDFSVSGNSSFGGNVGVDGNLTVDGSTTLGNDAASDELTINSASTTWLVDGTLTDTSSRAISIIGPNSASTSGTFVYIENEAAGVIPLLVAGSGGGNTLHLTDSGVLTLANSSDGAGGLRIYDTAGEYWSMGETAGTLSYSNPLNLTTDSNNLTISTTTSGILSLISAGDTNLYSAADYSSVASGSYGISFADQSTGTFNIYQNDDSIFSATASGALSLTSSAAQTFIINQGSTPKFTISQAGDILLSPSVSVGNDFEIGGNTTASGTLLVAGHTILSSTASISSALEVIGNLIASATFTAGATASHSFGGDLSIGDDLTIAGQIYLDDGLASAPALTFTNDANSGLYRLDDDRISLVTGGTTAQGLTINNSGYVGIGTTAPVANLEIKGSTLRIDRYGSDYGPYFDFYREGVQEWRLAGGATGAQDDFSLFNATGDRLMTVKQGGNIGIGTTSPSTRLDVSGTVSGTYGFFDQSLQVGHTASASYSRFGSNATTHLLSAISDLLITGDTEIDGILYADGAGYFAQTASVAGDFEVGDNVLHVNQSTGAVTFGSQASHSFLGDLSVQDDVTIGGNLTLTGDFDPSGQILLADGSAALPALAFSNDTDSGLYRIDTNKISLVTGGTEANGLIIDANGNVGIGTTTPGAKLEVNGNIYTSANNNYLLFGTNVATNPYVSGGSNNYLYLGTANNARLTVSTSGNVGIGTTNPTAMLSINSSGSNATINNPTSGQGVILSAAGGATTGQLRIISNDNAWSDNQSTAYFQIRTLANNNATFMGGTYGADAPLDRLQFDSEYTTITNNAYTDTPVATAMFEVVNDTAARDIMQIIGASSQSGDYFQITSYGGSAGNLLTLNSDGNVGIGTTSPGSKLDVNSTDGTSVLTLTNLSDTAYDPVIKFRTGATPAVRWTAGVDDSDSNKFKVEYADGLGGATPAFVIDSGGQVGIGTTTPSYKLHVVGDAYISEGLTIGTASSTFYDLLIQDDLEVQGTASLSNVLFTQANGNVGIGSTTPFGLLQVGNIENLEANVDGNLLVKSDSNGEAILLEENSGAESWRIGVDADGDLAFFDSGNNQNIVFQDGSANVGIGTTTPGSQMHLYGGASGRAAHSYTRLAIEDDENAAISIMTPGTNTGYLMFADEADDYVGGISYDHSDDHMGIFVNNADRITILSNGNVGVGTTAPEAELDIVGTASATLFYGDAGSAGAPAYSFSGDSDTGFTNPGSGQIGVISNGVERINFSNSGDIYASGLYFSRANPDVRLYRGAANQLFLGADDDLIVQGGNLGIGTTTPGKPLHVYNSTVDTLGRFESGDTKSIIELKDNSDSGFITMQGSSGVMSIGFTDDIFATNLNVNIDGNVGIGTTTPGAKLHTQTSASGDIAFFQTSADGGQRLDVGIDTTNKYIYFDPSDSLPTYDITFFKDGATPMMSLDQSSGNVGIGTTTPDTTLDVTTSGANGLVINQRTDFGTTSANLFFKDSVGTASLKTTDGRFGIFTGATVGSSSGTEMLSVLQGGNVGIGTSSPATRFETNIAGVASTEVIRASITSHSAGLGIDSAGTYWGSAIYQDGTKKFVVDSNYGVLVGQNYVDLSAPNNGVIIEGNVGIGTTTPGYKFVVSGESGFSESLHLAQPADILFANGQYIHDNGAGGLDLVVPTHSLGLRAGTDTSADIKFYTNGSAERMTIKNGGNVGIGTTTPSTKFQVAGAGLFNNELITGGAFQAASTTSASYSRFGTGTTGHGLASAYDLLITGATEIDGILYTDAGIQTGTASSTFYDLLIQDDLEVQGTASISNVLFTEADGNVGIGTSVPTTKLQIAGGVLAGGNYWTGQQSSSGIFMDGLDSYNAGFGTDASSNPGIYVDGAQKLTVLQSNGNVGIGTTTPTTKLEVAGGSIRLPIDNYVVWGAGWGIRQSSGNNNFDFVYGTPQVSFTSAGNVGIGTTTPQYKLSLGATSDQIGLYVDANHYSYWQPYNSNGDMTFQNYWSSGDGDIVFLPDGNVGIETTTPGETLEVVGTTRLGDGSGFDTGATLNVTKSSQPWITISDQATRSVGFGVTSSGVYISNDGTGDGTGDFYFGRSWTATNYPDTSVTNLVTIKGGGNVGIGTTSPGTKLSLGTNIAGVNSAATKISVYENSGTTIYGIGLALGSNYGLGLYSNNTATEVPRVFVESTGNVGIGTTAPGYKLDVNGAVKVASGQPVYYGSANENIYGASNNLYMGALNNIAFYGNSIEALRIQNDGDIQIMNGNVGIGTTTPSYKLHVVGDAYISEGLTIGTASSTFYDLLIQDDLEVQGTASISNVLFTEADGNVGIGTSAPSSLLELNVPLAISDGITVNTNDETYSIWSNSNQNGLVIANGAVGTQSGIILQHSSGNVGIGTTNPTRKLYVSGSSGMEIDLTGSYGTSVWGTSNSHIAQTISSSAGTIKLALNGDSYFTNNGNVGIGTTTPGAKLHVSGGAIALDNNQSLSWKDSGGAVRSMIALDGSNGMQYGVSSAAVNHQFKVSGSEIMRITSSNVGIGTTTPGTRLDVLGTADTAQIIRILKSSTGSQRGALGTSSGVGYLELYNDSTVKTVNLIANGDSYLTGGNVGIGTTTPGQLLDVYSATDARIRISAASGGDPILELYDVAAGAAKGFYYYDDSSDIVIAKHSSGGNQLVLGSTGNVGIGDTTPTSKLDIMGTAGNYDIFNIASSTGTSIMHVTKGGNVGIGGLTSPAQRVEIKDNSDSAQLRLTYTEGAIYTDIGTDSTGDLLLNPYGTAGVGQVILADNDTIAIGGAGGQVYNVIGDSVAGMTHGLNSDDDLYIEGDLEVNTDAYVDGNLVVAGAQTIIGTSVYESDVDMLTNLILNIGDSDTDFLASGGLQLAGPLNLLGDNINSTGNLTLNPTGALNIGGSDTTTVSTAATVGTYNIDGVGLTTFNLAVNNTSPATLNFGTSALANVINIGTGSGATDINIGNANSAVDLDGTITFGTHASHTFAGDLLIADDLEVVGFASLSNVFYSDPSTNRVGIGTTTPNYLAEIASTSAGSTASLLQIRNNAISDGTGAQIRMLSSTDAASTYGLSTLTSARDTSGNAKFIVGVSSNGNNMADVLSVVGNTSSTGGNVGIGTSTPGMKLDVNGTAIVRNAFSLEAGAQRWTLNTATGDDFTISESGVADRFTILNSSGNVGIGDTTPDAKFEVTASGGAGDDYYFSISDEDGTAGGLMTVTSQGYVGIGTSAPGAKLGVSGTGQSGWMMSLDDASSKGILLQVNSGLAGVVGYKIGTGYNDLELRAQGNTQLYLKNDGNVGIGDTTPTSKLDIMGTAGNYDIFNIASSTGTSIMHVTKGGNVGIGTTGPSYPLHVYSAEDTLLGLQSTDAIARMAISDISDSFWIGTASNIGWLGPNNVAGDGISINLTTGNVGVGTTAPGAKLDVVDSAASAMIYHKNTAAASTSNELRFVQFAQTDTTSRGSFEINSSFSNITDATRNSLVQFKTANAGTYGTAMTINGSNVGIGTTTPTSKLDIMGTAGNYDIFNIASSTGTSIMHVTKGGNVGIGTTAPGALLAVNSSAQKAIQVDVLDTELRDIYFSEGGDTNGGIVRYDANLNLLQLTTRNSGVENLGMSILRSNGNVGIGTTSPGSKLHVSGGNIRLDNTYKLELVNASSNIANAVYTDSNAMFFSDGTNINNVYLRGMTGLTISNTSKVGINDTTPDARFEIVASSAIDDYAFMVSQNEDSGTDGGLMTITSQGYVGIGTSGPESVLTFGANNPSITIDTNDGSDDDYLRITGGGGSGGPSRGGYIDFFGNEHAVSPGDLVLGAGTVSGGDILFKESGSVAMTIKDGGSIGIGITTPALKLQSHAGGAADPATSGTSQTGALRLSNAYGGGALDFGFQTDNDAWIQSVNTGNLSTEYNILLQPNGGNVGIGTTTPSYKLHVVGDAYISEGLTIGTASSTFYDLLVSDDLEVQGTASISNVLFAEAGGNVGIGTTTPTYKLHLKTAGNGDGLMIEEPDGQKYAFFATNTGQLRLYDGSDGAYRLTVDTSGSVGIGTTSPGSILDVTSPGHAILSLNSAAGNVSTLLFEENGTAKWDISSRNGFSSDELIIRDDSSTTVMTIENGASANQLYLKAGGNVGIGTTTPTSKLDIMGTAGNYDIFNIASSTGTSIMHVTKGGNVGIGTTSPQAVLQINNAADGSTLPFAIYNDNGNRTTRWSQDGDGDPFFLLSTDSGTDAVRIDSEGDSYLNGGNVGIGTTTPASKLYITDTQNAPTLSLNKTNAGANTYMAFYNDGTGSTQFSDGSVIGLDTDETLTFWNYENTAMRFAVNNGEKMRIASDGNVGIGTTTPGQVLTAQGSAGMPASSGTTQSGIFRIGNSANNAVLDFGQNSTVGGWIQSTNKSDLSIEYPLLLNPNGGNVGIGTSTPSYQLHVSGTYDGYGSYLLNSNTGSSAGGAYIQSNGTGNLLNLNYNGSDIYTFSPTQATFNAPASFSSAGDVAIAYDLNFTNQTSSFIKSNAPLYIEAGESFESNDLTLRTYNSGDVVLDSPGGVTLAQAQDWTIASSTAAFNVNSGLFNLDSANSRVGIGTTTPSYTLHVVGDMYASTSSTFNDALISDDLEVVGTASLSNVLFTEADGNVGIGTTTPSSLLEINGSTGITINSSIATDYSFFNLKRENTNEWAFILDGTTNDLQLYDYVNGVNRLVIDQSTGNVGIGTTSPQGLFNVSGAASSGGSRVVLTTNDGSVANSAIVWRNNVNATQAFIGSNYNVTDTGNLEFGTNGVGTDMIITGAGNVGIGTTTPAGKLDINQDADGIGLNIDSESTSYYGLEVNGKYGQRIRQDISNGLGLFVTRDIAEAGSSALVEFRNDNVANTQPTLVIRQDGTGDIVQFQDGTSPVMVVKDGGNVGIGTTAPDALLQVDGGSGTSGILSIKHSGSAHSILKLEDGTTDKGLLFYHDSGYVVLSHNEAGGAISDKDLVIREGNVGIGTTTPGAQLEVNSGVTDIVAKFISTDIDSDILLQDNVNYTRLRGMNGEFQVLTDGDTYTSIATLDGNVGIGTTSPSSKLEVSGTMSTGDEAAIRLNNIGGGGQIYRLQSGVSGVSHNMFGLYDVTDSALRMVVDTSGKVGINDTTPDARFEIVASSAIDDYAFMVSQNEDSGTDGGLMTITSQGYVGIGTSGPERELTISGPYDNYIRINGASSYNEGLELYNNDSREWIIDSIGSDASHRLRFYSNTAGEMVSFTQAGNVGIGTVAPSGKLEVVGGEIHNELSSDTASTFPVLRFQRSRGSSASPTVVQDGNYLGGLILQGYDGNSWENGAQIYARVDGTPGDGDLPTRLEFYTSPDSAASPQNRMVIKADGNVGIGTTAPGEKLVVDGNVLATRLLASSGGSIASPAIYAGWNNNGIYSVDSTTLGLVAGGVAGLYQKSGNVGIGTTTPGEKLDIKDGKLYLSDADITQPLTSQLPANTYGALRPGSGTEGGLEVVGLTDTVGSTRPLMFRGYFGTDDPTDTVAAMMFQAGKKGAGTDYTSLGDSETAFQWYNGGNIRMTMLGSGNVGIGTTTPSYNLHVVGDMYASTSSTFNDVLISDDLEVVGTASFGDEIYFTRDTNSTLLRSFTPNNNDLTLLRVSGYSTGNLLQDSASYGFSLKYMGSRSDINNSLSIFADNQTGSQIEALTILQDGNVGIGTSTPTEKLQVVGYIKGQEDAELKFKSDRSMYFVIDADNGETDRAFSFYHTSASTANEIFRIQENGNVGVGTTTPEALFNVASPGYVQIGNSGDDYYTKLTNNQLSFNRAATSYIDNSTVGGSLSFRTTVSTPGDTVGLFIKNDGNVGIGTTVPGAKLHVSGGNIRLDNTYKLELVNASSNIANAVYTDSNGMFFSDGTNINNVYLRGMTGLTISNTSKVGINDITPDARFEIVASSAIDDYAFMVSQNEDSGTDGGLMTITSQGYVGIGTSGPGTYGGNLVISAGSPQLTVSDTSVQAFLTLEQRSNIGYLTRDDGDLLILGTKTDSTQTSVSPQLTLNTDGNVGIGLTNPTRGLEVRGSTLALTSTSADQNHNLFFGKSDGTDGWSIGQGVTGADGNFRIYDNQAGNSPITIEQGTGANTLYLKAGNVGVGTTTPNFTGFQKALTLYAGSGTAQRAAIEINGSQENAGQSIGDFNVWNKGSNVSRILTVRGDADNSGHLTFYTSNAGSSSEKMRIQADGNVGIGTTTPGAKLHLVGSAVSNFDKDNYATTIIEDADGRLEFVASDSGSNAAALILNTVYGAGDNRKWFFGAGTSADSNKLHIGYSTNLSDVSPVGSSMFVMTTDGNVGIGTTTPLGGFHASATAAYFGAYSSARGYPLQVKAPAAGGNTFAISRAGSDVEAFRILVEGNTPKIYGNNAELRLGIADSSSVDFDVLTLDKVSDTDMRVGIRDTDPAATLEVVASTSNQDYAFMVSNEDGSAGDFLTITSQGYVGIGTSAPTFVSGSGLHISNSSQANLRLDDSGNYTDIANQEGDLYFINRKSTGDIKFRVNSSTEAITIIEDGNIGIGTTTPGAKLNISGTSGTIGGDNPDVTSMIQTSGGGSGLWNLLQIYNSSGATTQGAGISFAGKDAGGSRRTLSLIGGGATDLTDGAPDGYFAISTANNGTVSEVMRIDSTGNVGIGTTTPAETLDVKGGIRYSGTAITSITSGRGGLLNEVPSTTNPTLVPAALSQNTTGIGSDGATTLSLISNGVNVLNTTAGGNVGIGTTTPGRKLEIVDTVGFPSLRLSGAADVAMEFLADGTDYWTMGADNGTANKFMLSTASDPSSGAVLTVDRSGSVGIGTTSPGSILDVTSTGHAILSLNSAAGSVSNLLFEENGTAKWDISSRNGFSSDELIIRDDSSTTVMTIENGASANQLYLKAGGNVGIGDTTPTSTLDILGSASHYDMFNIASSTGDSVFHVTKGGRVGVGTTTPDYDLVVVGHSGSGSDNNGVKFMANNTVDENRFLFEVGGSGNNSILHMYDASEVEKIKLNSGTGQASYINAGNVGIGDTSPDARFEIDIDSSSEDFAFLLTDSSDGDLMTVTSQGYTSIGTATHNNTQLTVQQDSTGNIVDFKDGSTSIFTIADGGQITIAGSITYSGSGKPKRSIILTSEGATTPTANGAAQTKVDGTNHTYYVLDFDASTDESSYWHWTMPDSYDGGTIDVTLYWEAAATSGDVVWATQTAGVASNNAEDIDPTLGSAQTVTDAVQGNANDLGSATISSWTPGWVAGDYVVFKVYRDADSGSDTMTGDARLTKVKIEYSVSAESD